MKRLWWLLLVPVVAVAIFLLVRGKGTAGDTQGAFVTTPVDRGNIVGRVTATGTLSATVTVEVGSQVSGRIAALNADFNSQVTKGQVLAKLDPQLFEAAVAQAKANTQAAEGNLAKAKAQAVDAQRQLVRQKQLAAQKLIAQADLDTAQSAAEVAVASVTAAQGNLAQARASLHQAEVNLGYTTIVSPIDGTVISRAVDVGQTVAASLSAPTLFTIAENLKRMQVDTNVSEADVGRLREGLDTDFTVDAFPTRSFKGRIRQIRFAPQVVSNVVTYDAVIDVDNPDLALRPGMTANVTFIYARADDVLRVPNAALRFRYEPPQTQSTDGGARKWAGQTRGGQREGQMTFGEGSGEEHKRLWVLRDGKPVMARVVVGLSDGSFTEVKSGLQLGDLVITDREGAGSPTPSEQQRRPGGGMRRIL